MTKTHEGVNRHGVDFSIRQEGSKFMLDLFDAAKADANAAHIDTVACDSLAEAKREAAGWRKRK